MRIQYHPKYVKDKPEKVTGKFTPSEWSKSDSRLISRYFISTGRKDMDQLLKVLYTKHLETWKKLYWFSRGHELAAILNNVMAGKFCACCGLVFPRKDVCNACGKTEKGRQLGKDLGYARASETWHNRPLEFRKAKGIRISETRRNWTPEQVAANRSSLIEAQAKLDQKAKAKKAQATYKRKHGVTNPSQNPEVQALKRQNQRERYGIDHPCQRDEVKAKLKATALSKTEEDWAARDKKSKATYKQKTGYTHNMRNPNLVPEREAKSIEKWGTANPASSPVVRDLIRDTWERKYGYREIFARPETRAKIKETLLERYGVENPMGHGPSIQRIQDHRKKPVVYKGKTYYVDSEPERLAFTELKKRYGKVYTQYDPKFPHLGAIEGKTWLPDFYIPELDRYVEIKCDYTLFHGNDGQVFARNKEKAETTPNCEWLVYYEQHFVRLPKQWYRLTFTEVSKYLAVKTHKHRKRNFIAEVAKLVGGTVSGSCVTLMGKTLYCATLIEQAQKTTELRDLGLTVLWDYEWQHHKTAAKKYVLSYFGLSKFSLGARKTELEFGKLNQKDKQFFKANHLQGEPRSGLCYRLTYNKQVVAAMVFASVVSIRGSKPNPNQFELVRFATVGNISGAASKLFSAFLKSQKVTEVISYSDRQHFSGGVYKILGFTNTKVSAPDYKSVWSFSDYWVRSKQATKLSALAKFEGFDPSLSEKRNSELLGLERVYDCGKLKWVYTV